MGDFQDWEQIIGGPIFVVGAARSGTTWVFDIMASHPQVTGVYESWLFTPQNGLASLFTSAHWPSSRSGLSGLLPREDLIRDVRQFSTRLLSRAVRPEHRYIVEKSPSHLFVMDLIHEVFPAARFVHVLRDGRDVCVSVRAASKYWVPQWAKTFGRSIYSSAQAWQHAVRRARQLGSDLGGQFLEIQYESIKQDPIESYRKLFDFCQIPYDESLLRQIYERTDFNLNFKPKETGFRRGGRVGDWTTHFSVVDAVIFNIVAGETLIDTGYEKNRRWIRPLRKKVKPPALNVSSG